MSHRPAIWGPWSGWGWDPQRQQRYRQRQNTDGQLDFEFEIQTAPQHLSNTDPRYTGQYDSATLQRYQYEQNQGQYGSPPQQNYSYNQITSTANTGYASTPTTQSYGYGGNAQSYADPTAPLRRSSQQDTPQGYSSQDWRQRTYEDTRQVGDEEEDDDGAQAVGYRAQTSGGGERDSGTRQTLVFKVADQTHLRTSSDPNNTERLDKDFARVKTKEIPKFFKTGRILGTDGMLEVFAILWTEPAVTEPSTISEATGGVHARKAYSVVRFEEPVFTEIRRFIVIRAQGDHHSLCIPILTYGKRGTVNRPDAGHHAIAYMTARAPNPLPDEQLNRHSIKIIPRGGEQLHAASRINFSKIYTVEHNLKVKSIGVVPDEYLAWVKLYCQESTGLRPGS